MARIGFGVDGLGRKGHETLRKVAAVGDTGNAPLPGSVFTLRQVRLLKIAVIVMSVLLVGGFAFVLAAIVYQASHPRQASMGTAASLDVGRVAALDQGLHAGPTQARQAHREESVETLPCVALIGLGGEAL